MQKNDGLMYGLGATLTPVKGLSMRVYYGLNEGADDNKENKQNLATFIGYKDDSFSIGAENNLYKNDGNEKGNDMSGFSI